MRTRALPGGISVALVSQPRRSGSSNQNFGRDNTSTRARAHIRVERAINIIRRANRRTRCLPCKSASGPNIPVVEFDESSVAVLFTILSESLVSLRTTRNQGDVTASRHKALRDGIVKRGMRIYRVSIARDACYATVKSVAKRTRASERKRHERINTMLYT